MPRVSIVICSLNRPTEFTRCLDSLKSQTFQDYELILCQEEGRLVELKDKGWRKSTGEIVVWIDDDVVCEKEWLQNIVTIFDTRSDIVGVTGPTFVPPHLLFGRDVFKGGLVGWFYNHLFLDGKKYLPGHISSWGASTHGANYNTHFSRLPHFVDFLEPSQFAIRRNVLEKVGGFDLAYGGVAEWCDVDLCYRIRGYGKLLYHPQVKVGHLPAVDGTTGKRKETQSRYENYCRWADRYVRKSLKNRIYRLFLRTYFCYVAFRGAGGRGIQKSE